MLGIKQTHCPRWKGDQCMWRSGVNTEWKAAGPNRATYKESHGEKFSGHTWSFAGSILATDELFHSHLCQAHGHHRQAGSLNTGAAGGAVTAEKGLVISDGHGSWRRCLQPRITGNRREAACTRSHQGEKMGTPLHLQLTNYFTPNELGVLQLVDIFSSFTQKPKARS
ncbi:uncharacterized protein FYW23_016511 isoform 2-T2 [Sylvia borin]